MNLNTQIPLVAVLNTEKKLRVSDRSIYVHLYISNLKSKPENCVNFVLETLTMILSSSVRSIEGGRGQ